MDRHCRQCGFQIVASSPHAEDLKAQAKGYCCSVCEQLYKGEHEYVIERMLRGA